jgi:hypothetical protein
MADSNPYNNPYYAQYQSQAGSSNPYAANPYYAYPSGAAGPSKPLVANAHEYDIGVAAQQSAYVPGAHTGKGATGVVIPKGQKRKTVLRKGGGKLWEDPTLLEWDSCECERYPDLTSHVLIKLLSLAWFRLFVGDVSNDVTDEILSQAFAKYPTFTKARVIRDKLSAKVSHTTLKKHNR